MSGSFVYAGDVTKEPPQQSGLILLRQIVFPDPHDPPAFCPEGPRDEPVAGSIARKFLHPERCVVLRLCGMPGATVPETAVDEDGEAQFRENEIRTPENGVMPTPADDSISAQQRSQHDLGVFVTAPADPRHDKGALRLGEYVSHDASAT